MVDLVVHVGLRGQKLGVQRSALSLGPAEAAQLELGGQRSGAIDRSRQVRREDPLHRRQGVHDHVRRLASCLLGVRLAQ